MGSWKHQLRLVARHFGVDVGRYPVSDPLWRVSRLLDHRNVTVVLDVGANDGSFATDIRRLGYLGRIHSFEPVTDVYDRLRANSSHDRLWFTHPFALGDSAGTARINVAGNGAASSSLLPMLDRHRESAPDSTYVRTEEAQVRSLDDIRDELSIEADDRVYLKIDVQGFERPVLLGARSLLQTNVVGLQMELSLVPLYSGAMTWEDGLDLAKQSGMRLAGLHPGFTDRASGELLQFDAVFVRVDADSSGGISHERTQL